MIATYATATPSSPWSARTLTANESTATLLAVIESMKRDRRLAMAQADLAIARLAHAQQADTWQAIGADIDVAKAALAAIRLRLMTNAAEPRPEAKTWQDEG